MNIVDKTSEQTFSLESQGCEHYHAVENPKEEYILSTRSYRLREKCLKCFTQVGNTSG